MMRDTSKRGWQSWRVTLAAPVPSPVGRFPSSRLTAAAPAPLPQIPPEEAPSPDGIRHDLVARVRAEIEAGTYDNDERWALAEERLLARFESAR